MNTILNKFISQSGFCSRRQAEVFIKEGKVFVNGRRAEAGMRVNEDDEIKIGGKTIKNDAQKIYIIMNKPADYVCTNRKFKNEKSVFDLLPVKLKKNNKLFIAGRLDKDSRGLILITNDGELAQKITHPKYEHEKIYKFKIHSLKKGSENEINNIINQFKKGVYIGEGDGKVKVKNIEYEDNLIFKIILTQGKKRQIRRMFKALGYEVDDLLRLGLGNLRLNDLPSGKWEAINERIKIA